MNIALTTALLFGTSHSWLSFSLGVAAGLAFVLLFRRVRRKEDR